MIQISVCAQQKKKTYLRPKIMKLPPEKFDSNNPLVKILKEQQFSDSFVWEINADSLLVPKTVYKEIIEELGGASYYTDELSDRVVIRQSATVDTVKLKKIDNKNQEENVIGPILSSYLKLTTYTITIKNDIIIFVDDKTKKEEKFKAFLNKQKDKIIYLKNIKSNKIYSPGKFEGPSIGM
ncbi:hypothetical protein AR687_21305 [Flavobacteriaceae bacterium CRH]|nr:hypothetical protein AR687_21305 [Flavobacteriaceae bacterium CRH]